MLTIPWIGFLAIVVIIDIFLNAIFALLYLIDGNAIAGVKEVGFLEAFFFSVQTLASIGYGVMNPQTLYANLIVTLESITSLTQVATYAPKTKFKIKNTNYLYEKSIV